MLVGRGQLRVARKNVTLLTHSCFTCQGKMWVMLNAALTELQFFILCTGDVCYLLSSILCLQLHCFTLNKAQL